VPEHCGIPGNEIADKLARQGAAMSLLGPELALGIPRCSATEAIKNWTELQHCTAWKNLPAHRHGELFICRPCKKRDQDLHKLSRYQLRMVAAFLTGHASVKKYLNIMGFFDGDPNCRFCKQETESVPYYLLLWLTNTTISLGSSLQNLKIYAQTDGIYSTNARNALHALRFSLKLFFHRKYVMTTQVSFKFLHKAHALSIFHQSADVWRYCIQGTETWMCVYLMTQGACAENIYCMHANLKLHSGTLASNVTIVCWVAPSLY
jgi:hypothetical protein